MKKIIVCILCVIICLSFSSCSLLYDLDAVDSFDVGYSTSLNNAFLSSYNWDGTDETTNIVVPEKYEGIPITEFGGYFGRGGPCSFSIRPTEYAKEKLCDKADEWFYMSDIRNVEISNIKTINFNVHISKNIKIIENLSLGGFIGGKYIEDEKEYYDVFVLLCTVTCDDENKSFYAKNGKLYFSDNDTLVTDILYYDFDIDGYLSEPKDESIWFNAI